MKQQLYKMSMSSINITSIKEVSQWATDWLIYHADHKLVYIDDHEEMGDLFFVTADCDLAFQFSLRWGSSPKINGEVL